jgi:hypothetical protein
MPCNLERSASVIVKHELTIARRCPVNDAHDIYQVLVEATRLIKVEDILAAAASLPERAFQEDLTVALAARLGCRVTTTGFHRGVKTTCCA